MKPVSVVIPAFRERADLAANLPALLDELGRRSVGDEVIVVDDAGDDDLAAWVAATFPPPETFDRAGADVRVLRRRKNAGPARAALDGVKSAGHDLVLLLAPHVRVREGFLAPLAAALNDRAVAAAAPRVLAPDGRGLARLVWRQGLLEIESGDGAGLAVGEEGPADAAWAPLCALLARRDELLAAGFDARFAPGDLADVDLAWTWKRAGRRVVVVPAAAVDVARADASGPRAHATRAIEVRSRLLLTWKHLDAPERCAEHQDALEAFALEALLAGRREDLAALALALEADAGR